MKFLKGHTSPETAFVVKDYSYGFRLRCKIRYWIETDMKKGSRLCYQTIDTRRQGEVWNKPKCSTYARFGGAMYLDEKDRVVWSGLTQYSDSTEIREWIEVYGEGMNEDVAKLAKMWLAAKELYELKYREVQSEESNPK
jgi:hypothetical protein